MNTEKQTVKRDLPQSFDPEGKHTSSVVTLAPRPDVDLFNPEDREDVRGYDEESE